MKRAEKWSLAEKLQVEQAQLAERVTRFAEERWPGFEQQAEEEFGGNYRRVPRDVAMRVAFTLFEERWEGRTVLQRFLATEPALTPVELQLATAEQESWLSWWRVEEANLRTGIALRDLITGAERTVFDVRAAKTLRRDVVICARILELGPVAIFSGVFPIALHRTQPRLKMALEMTSDYFGPPTPAALRRDPVGILNVWRMVSGLLRPGATLGAEAEA